MPDNATIRRTISKRVNNLVSFDEDVILKHPEYIHGPILITHARDGVALTLAVNVFGTAYPLIFRLSHQHTRQDILNVTDEIVEQSKWIARHRPTVQEFIAHFNQSRAA